MQRLRQIWNRIRRGAMFALVLLLFLLLQNTVLSEASLLGVRALFLPALVGLTEQWEKLGEIWLPCLLLVLPGPWSVMIAAGKAAGSSNSFCA